MYQQKRGKKTRFFMDYLDPLTGQSKTMSITMDKGGPRARKEAEMVLTERINKKISEVKRTDIIQGVRFGELVDEFLAYSKQRIRRTTYFNHLTMAKNLRETIDNNALVTKLTPLFLTKVLENLLYGERQLSNGYVSKYKIFLHQILDYAVERSYLQHNPVDDIKINYRPNEDRHPTRNKFLEADELRTLLDYAYQRNQTYAALCEWLYQTGTRFGESAALRFSDVYQDRNHWFVSITGTLEYDHVKIGDQHKTNTTKTPAGRREVVLSKRAVQIYQERRAIAGEDDALIFATQNGTPIQASALNTFLRTAKKNLDIDKSISSHIFRHTHISKLAELGVPLYVIQQRVGHSNSRVTREIYTHVTREAVEKMAPKLEEL